MKQSNANTAAGAKGVLFPLFCAWTFVLMGRPQDVFSFLVPLRPALVITGITTVVFLVGYGHLLQKRRFYNPQVKAYTALFLLMVIGIPFAYHRRIAFMFIFTVYLSNAIFFYIFFTTVDSIEKVRTMLFICCAVTMLYGAFSLAEGIVIKGRLEAGKMFDPNDLAYLLVSYLPYNLLFLSSDESLIKRIVCTANIPVTIILTLMTGSRGGFVALVAVIGLLLLRKSLTMKSSYKIALILLGAVAIFFKLESIDLSRYKTLLDVQEDYNVTDEWGRKEIWKSGLILMASNPLTGVGVSCFDMAIGEERQMARAIPKWHTAHTSWIQIGTETGLIGFILFGLIIWRAFRIFRRIGKHAEWPELRKIGEMALVGFSGHFVCSMFLSQAYSIYFVWYIALSAVLMRLGTHDGNGEYKTSGKMIGQC